MQLIFNELSLEDVPQEKIEGEKILEQFVIAYNESVKEKYGFLREIMTCIDLNSVKIAKDYWAAQWRNSPNTDKDLANRFRGICDRQIITEMNEPEVELSCTKGIGKGLLSAYENKNVAISMATHDIWSEFIFDAKLYDLISDESLKVQVYNLTNSAQLDTYFKEIKQRKLEKITSYKTGSELLKDIGKLFPSLIFHKNAMDQLKSQVEPQHIPAICRKLLELEECFSGWDGKEFKECDFKTKMTPESKATLDMFKKEHTFSFEDKEVIVSYHLRYTGNIPGRIYFYPDAESLKGLVCSLTTKLKTVSNR
jgi:hypothetical protein